MDNKTSQGQARMNTIVQSLLLRRTKETKSQVTGMEIVKLPEKTVQEHSIILTETEQEVYNEVFSFSQQAMISYMRQHEEKEEDKALINHVAGGGNARDFQFRPPSNGGRVDQAQEAGDKYPLKQNGDIKAHHLLVLLLRLRQVSSY